MSVCLLLCTLTGKIEVILGENQVASDLKTHSKVDFKQIIMSCLSIVNKVSIHRGYLLFGDEY